MGGRDDAHFLVGWMFACAMPPTRDKQPRLMGSTMALW